MKIPYVTLLITFNKNRKSFLYPFHIPGNLKDKWVNTGGNDEESKKKIPWTKNSK